MENKGLHYLNELSDAGILAIARVCGFEYGETDSFAKVESHRWASRVVFTAQNKLKAHHNGWDNDEIELNDFEVIALHGKRSGKDLDVANAKYFEIMKEIFEKEWLFDYLEFKAIKLDEQEKALARETELLQKDEMLRSKTQGLFERKCALDKFRARVQKEKNLFDSLFESLKEKYLFGNEK